MILAVESHYRCDRLADNAAADVGADLLADEWHHGYRSGGGEPIGLVVATGEVAGGFVAVRERHGGENTEAGAGLAYSTGSAGKSRQRRFKRKKKRM